MPWHIIKKNNGRFCIAKEGSSTPIPGGCHSSEADAKQHMAALYANEKPQKQTGDIMNDTIIYFGDAVKALDDKGRIGGYLVRFSEGEHEGHKDLDGEYFDSKSYFGPKDGDGEECLFDHGYTVPADRFIKDIKEGELAALQQLADRTFAPIKTKRDAVGIFAETVLNLEDEYEKFIYGRVKKGKIGWSSGSPGHRVKKEQDGYISRWPICEGSLTPRPAEPLNRAITMKSLASVKFIELNDDEHLELPQPNKSILFKPHILVNSLNKHIDDLVDGGMDRSELIKSIAHAGLMDVESVEEILNGSVLRPSDVRLKAFARVLDISFDHLKSLADRDQSKTIKGIFEDALADKSPSRWEMDSLYCELISKLATAAASTRLTGSPFDWQGKVSEATEEYSERLEALAVNQINEYVESGSDERFYLKSFGDVTSDLSNVTSIDLDSHSQLVVSTLRDLRNRFRGNHEGRVKQGRVLSDRNRQRIAACLESIKAEVSDLEDLLTATAPMATDSEKRAAQTQFLRLQHQALQRSALTN